ncbi:RNA polymerase sigma factor [Clostridiaceae bacterium M8S5]|nr:RNA polymerase sigma factor [Clostridiaceae bacterium M8S5]
MSKLENIYILYYKEMFYVAINILNDYHEAEDVVQNAILKIFNELSKIMIPKSYKTKTYITTIVKNMAINRYNRKKLRKLVPMDNIRYELLQGENTSLDENIINLENEQEIIKLLIQIKKSYSDILALKYKYELSNFEIAQFLGISQGNVRVKIHRAKRSLKKIIKRSVTIDGE